MQTSTSLSFVVLLITLLGATHSPDPALTLATGGVLLLGLTVLWPAGGPPVMLLSFGLQWLSVAIKPLQSALTGEPLNDLAERSVNLDPAAWLGLAALTALCIGMRFGVGNVLGNLAGAMRLEARNLSSRIVLTTMLTAIVAGHVLEMLAPSFGPAYQIVLALSTVRLAALFVLTFWCLTTRRQLPLLAVVVGIELVLGMIDFFSNFKSALLIVMIAALAAEPRMRTSGIVAGVGGAALLLFAGIYWSHVKPDYRSFLSSTTPPTIEERVGYLAREATSFDDAKLNNGLDRLVIRQSYIDFLAHTMAYVPDRVPHEGGARTVEAVTHVITPRILFPNKPALAHDTDVTIRYTGLNFTNAAATSISIGWLGDLYIDYGFLGAVIASLGLGFGIGFLTRTLVAYRGLPVVANVAIASAALLPYILFERPLVKLVGEGLMTFIAAMVLQRIVIPRALAILGAQAAMRSSRALR